MGELKPRIHEEATGLDYVQFYARDTSRKIRAANKAKGERGEPLAVNPPYSNCRRTMIVPSENGGGCTKRVWKKRTRFCSTTLS